VARPKKVWLATHLWASSSSVEVALSALTEAGALGIELDDGLSPESLPKYPAGEVLLKAYFEPALGLSDDIKSTLYNFFSACELPSREPSFLDVIEEDWQGNFVRSCTTFMVEPHIYVVPSFEIDAFRKNPAGDLFIEMDPENAFGTGHHQTTKLCLKNIAKQLLKIPKEQRALMKALDVGTGSGILAILMKKLGIGHVCATENDLDAVETAQRNVLKNQVDVTVIAVDDDYRYLENSFDLIVANILAPTLKAFVHELIRACNHKGYIMLSGILNKEAPELIATYQQHGAILAEQENMDDWCVLIFAKV
jgi:ribosomal protein L11 methyltransferase